MENITGRQLGSYEVVAPLGEGGMAAVYKGYQPGVDRYVALKVLPKRLAEDPAFIGRFDQEAKILAQLQHPHILPVFDYGEAEGHTYIVMPYLPGGTLAALLHGAPVSLSQTTTIISQLADALDYAHDKGLLHRDIKPSNVLFDEKGNCLLADFGIAKMFSSTSQFTGTGGIVGTPDYMSPEQGQGKELDRRSDVYSLGIILYQMVTGRVPFTAETPVATVFKHIHDPLPAPREFNSSLPEPIEKVLLRALAKDPADRFPTAGDLAATLQAAISVDSTAPTYLETPAITTTVVPQETLQKVDDSNKNWLLPLFVVILLLILCGGGFYYLYTSAINPMVQSTVVAPLTSQPKTQSTITAEITSKAPKDSDDSLDVAGLAAETNTPGPAFATTTDAVAKLNSTVTLSATSFPIAQAELSREVVVDATIPRTDTGIQILSGQRLTIEYLSGSWRAGPSSTWQSVGAEGDTQVLYKATFPVPDSPIMALVGGVGTSVPAAFGNRLEFISNAEGNLWLGPNDDGVTDNAGKLIMRITISDAKSLFVGTEMSATSTPSPLPEGAITPLYQSGENLLVTLNSNLWTAPDVTQGVRFNIAEAGTTVEIIDDPSWGPARTDLSVFGWWYPIDFKGRMVWIIEDNLEHP